MCVKEKVPRAAQDEYALRSQQRYARAKADGFFAGEIQSVHNGKVLVHDDEHPRAESLDLLQHVARHHDAPALGTEPLEQVDHVQALAGVEPVQGLV